MKRARNICLLLALFSLFACNRTETTSSNKASNSNNSSNISSLESSNQDNFSNVNEVINRLNSSAFSNEIECKENIGLNDMKTARKKTYSPSPPKSSVSDSGDAPLPLFGHASPKQRYDLPGSQENKKDIFPVQVRPGGPAKYNRTAPATLLPG